MLAKCEHPFYHRDMQGHEQGRTGQAAEVGDTAAWRESAIPRTLNRGAVLELRGVAIAFLKWADGYLGLPRTIPDKETRRQMRRGG
jgi:hypothetical protein